MFQGDFDSAREMAGAEDKWLIITVSDPSEFACEAMKRDVWNVKSKIDYSIFTKPTYVCYFCIEVKEFIKENFIFAMVDLSTLSNSISYFSFHSTCQRLVKAKNTKPSIPLIHTHMSP
jgi:thioredoxin-related protein